MQPHGKVRPIKRLKEYFDKCGKDKDTNSPEIPIKEFFIPAPISKEDIN